MKIKIDYSEFIWESPRKGPYVQQAVLGTIAFLDEDKQIKVKHKNQEFVLDEIHIPALDSFTYVWRVYWKVKNDEQMVID